MMYPPFCDIVYILVSGENEKEAETECMNIGGIINDEKALTTNIIEVLGPSAAPIKKIKNKYRFRILIKVKDSKLMHPMMEAIYRAHENSGTKNLLTVDINPNNMI